MPRQKLNPLPAAAFLIMVSLADEDLHGYALIQDIRRRTDGEISLTASTLYAAVKRLLASEWIEEAEHRTPPPGHDERRRDLVGGERPGVESDDAEVAREEHRAVGCERRGRLFMSWQ